MQGIINGFVLDDPRQAEFTAKRPREYDPVKQAQAEEFADRGAMWAMELLGARQAALMLERAREMIMYQIQRHGSNDAKNPEFVRAIAVRIKGAVDGMFPSHPDRGRQAADWALLAYRTNGLAGMQAVVEHRFKSAVKFAGE